MVLGLTAQDSKTMTTDPLVPKPKGGVSEQGAPPYPSLTLRRQQYPLECNPCKLTWVIPSESFVTVLRDVQRDLWLPMLLFVLTCIGPIWAKYDHAHHVLTPFLTCTPSDDMASRCIPQDLQIPFKECSWSYVVIKIGIPRNIRAYKMSLC